MTVTHEPTPAAPARQRRRLGDVVFAGLSRGAAITIVLALAGVFLFLFIEGFPGLHKDPSFYGNSAHDFVGYVAPLLFGTVVAAAIAVLVAAPLAFGIALIISHYAPKGIAAPAAYLVDLLAAVPSVVFGLWGITVFAKSLVPILDWLHAHVGWIPLFGQPSATGRTILTAGLVLAIMILPIITAITREIYAQTPRLNQEAALALGATRWEMVRLAVLPYARSGMVSATMLGLGRALGETMAVAMVLSPGGGIQWNLIGSANPASIASNIASNYKEGTPGKVQVLIATGLVLFLLTFVINFAARAVIARAERKVER